MAQESIACGSVFGEDGTDNTEEVGPGPASVLPSSGTMDRAAQSNGWETRTRGSSSPPLGSRGGGIVSCRQPASPAPLFRDLRPPSPNLAHLSRRSDPWCGQPAALSGELAALSDELAALFSNVDALWDDVDGLSGDVETLSGEVGVLFGDVAALWNDVAALSDDVETLFTHRFALSVDVLHYFSTLRTIRRRFTLSDDVLDYCKTLAAPSTQPVPHCAVHEPLERRAGIPACRFWGLSSPQLSRRAGKPAEPAAWKGCPTGFMAAMRGSRIVVASRDVFHVMETTEKSITSGREDGRGRECHDRGALGLCFFRAGASGDARKAKV